MVGVATERIEVATVVVVVVEVVEIISPRMTKEMKTRTQSQSEREREETNEQFPQHFLAVVAVVAVC